MQLYHSGQKEHGEHVKVMKVIVALSVFLYTFVLVKDRKVV